MDNSPLRASYLRFTVPNLGKPVVGARLRLYAVNPSRVTDIQVDRWTGTTRRILVGFEGSSSAPGAIGIYVGQ